MKQRILWILTCALVLSGAARAGDLVVGLKERRSPCDLPDSAVDIRNMSQCTHYKVRITAKVVNGGCGTACKWTINQEEATIAPGACTFSGRVMPTCGQIPGCCIGGPNQCDAANAGNCSTPGGVCNHFESALVEVIATSVNGTNWDPVDPPTVACDYLLGDHNNGCVVDNCCADSSCDGGLGYCAAPPCPATNTCGAPGQCQSSPSGTYTDTNLKTCVQPNGTLFSCSNQSWIRVKTSACQNQCTPPCLCATTSKTLVCQSTLCQY